MFIYDNILYRGEYMKRIKKIILLLLVLIPISVNALSINVDETVNLESELEESSILIGNNVQNNGITNGANIMIGNNITYNGESDYLFLAGNNVTINGTIKNDAFIFGNLIKFTQNSNIERDLLLVGSEITIDGSIKNNITVYATKVIVKSDVENIDIKANDIEIYGSVNGKLSHNEDANISIQDESKINEIVITEKLVKEKTVQENVMNFIYNYGSILLIFLFIYFLVPKLFNNIENKNKDLNLLSFFSLFGFGTLSLILIPVICMILVSLAFGISLAILILILYIIAIWLSSIFSSYLLGYIIWSKIIKKENNALLIGLIGISIINILSLIPTIGLMITVISVMVGMGIILQQFKRN